MPFQKATGFLLFFLVSTTAISAEEAPSVQALKDWCTQLSKELKSVKYDRCISKKWVVEGFSTGGRPIPYLVWENPVKKEEGKEGKKILVLGAIHGDEIASVSVVFRWTEFLDVVKADSVLRQHRYMLFPLLNPDGFFAKPRTRTNLNGVDLNRNFATSEWDQKAQKFWLTKTKNDPRRNPGKKAAAEMETQLIQKWIDQFQPDLIISVHAPYRLLDHDGPIEFPRLRSPLPVKALGAYPGSLGTYAGLERGIPVVTPEFPSATQLLSQKAIEDLFVFIMKAKY